MEKIEVKKLNTFEPMKLRGYKQTETVDPVSITDQSGNISKLELARALTQGIIQNVNKLDYGVQTVDNSLAELSHAAVLEAERNFDNTIKLMQSKKNLEALKKTAEAKDSAEHEETV